MANYSPALVSKLNAIAHEYQQQINAQIEAVINQKKYINTGASVNSLKVEVINGTPEKAPEIIVTFADSLNILDKRKLAWTKMPVIEALDAWAQTKTFNYIPGYKNGLAPNLPPWKAKKRVEWAIAINKKKFDTWRPKPWRKKSLSNVLKEMNRNVLLAFEKAIDEDFQQAATKGLNG